MAAFDHSWESSRAISTAAIWGLVRELTHSLRKGSFGHDLHLAMLGYLGHEYNTHYPKATYPVTAVRGCSFAAS
jgi:hypothetical protein